MLIESLRYLMLGVSSLFRFVVQQRTCAELAPRVPDEGGGCTCPSGTLASGGGCLSLAMLLPSILLPAMLLAAAMAALLIRRRIRWVRWHTQSMHIFFLVLLRFAALVCHGLAVPAKCLRLFPPILHRFWFCTSYDFTLT